MGHDASTDSQTHALHVQQLFVKHQQALLAYILSIEPNIADAQDILQETFLTVSQKTDTFAEGTNFLAWACTCARYNTLCFQRSSSRRATCLGEDVVELVAQIPVDQAEFENEVSLMRQCMQRLAPRARDILWQRYHSAKTPEHIATDLGWTSNAVRVALSRARAYLRQCMERRMLGART